MAYWAFEVILLFNLLVGNIKCGNIQKTRMHSYSSSAIHVSLTFLYRFILLSESRAEMMQNKKAATINLYINNFFEHYQTHKT